MAGKNEVLTSPEIHFGVHGRILVIDLSRHQIDVEDYSKDYFYKYLGGKALGMSLLAEQLVNVEPLDEKNKLGFFTGPLTGFLPGSGTCSAVTKSPLTNTLTDPTCQGYFGEAIKYAGYDGVIIEGKSDKPVYIFMSDSHVTVLPADDLFGLSTSQVENTLKTRHRDLDHASVASIGQAGENMVSFASIIADKRAFGRGGAGAVMGSKNLKAIIVGGRDMPVAYDRRLLNEKILSVAKQVRSDHKHKVYEMFGTIGVFDKHKTLGSLSGSNYRRQETDPGDLSVVEFLNHSSKKVRACAKCLINCSRETVVEKEGALIKTNGPEFESAWALGPNVDNRSVQTVAMADYLCDEFGLDTLSTGAVIAFFQECVENGLVNCDDTSNILELIRKIATREDFGNILALGTKMAAKKLSPESSLFTAEVKGMETPAYDPRGFYGIALAYAISKRGGCHRKAFCSDETEGRVSGLEISGKPKLVADQEVKSAWVDSLGICKWATGGLQGEFYSEAIYAITGEKLSVDELKLIGERAINIAQVFNRQQGYRREDDTLPKRFIMEKRYDNDHLIEIAVLEQMKDEYYRLKGWDQEGKPSIETLQKLGIENFIDLLI